MNYFLGFLFIAMHCSEIVVCAQEKTEIAQVVDETLRKELLTLEQTEQDARKEMIAAFAASGVSLNDGKPITDPKVLELIKNESEKLAQIDRGNQTRLKEIIAKYGWPGKSLVGEDGAQAAWMIVQHADNDRDWQKSCLSLMETMPPGEVSGKSIAYLTDRVLVGDKQPQKYGTQLGPNFVPLAIADQEHVDQRRAKLGLEPLAAYIEYAKTEYAKLAAPPAARTGADK